MEVDATYACTCPDDHFWYDPTPMMPTCCEEAVCAAGVTCPTMAPECCTSIVACANGDVCTDWVEPCCTDNSACAGIG